MPRPKSKDELLELSRSNFELLWALIDSMPEEASSTAFDFSQLNKKEAHWSRDKNVRDVLIHLYEWHQLLTSWIKSNTSGHKADFLPAPYTWKTYGDMNVAFWRKHQETDFATARQLLNASHKEVITLVGTFSNEALFTKKYYDWTGTTSLGSYCVSSLSSHYDWAIKKLKAHLRLIGKATKNSN